MPNLSKAARITILGLAATLAVGACGGDDDDSAEKRGAASEESAAAAPGESAAAAVEEQAAPDSAEHAGGALKVEAKEFSLAPGGLHAAPGTVKFEYVNLGAIEHTLVIEGVDGLRLVTPAAQDTDAGEATLEPGTYTLFCDVPGHRAAGMETSLTVG